MAVRSLFAWARRFKRDALTLWFAWRHPQTPARVKAMCLFVVAYAVSPVDLIPDFIPLLGYVDDAVVLPALIWGALRMLPGAVLLECRTRTQTWLDRRLRKSRLWTIAAIVLLIWAVLMWLLWRMFQ